MNLNILKKKTILSASNMNKFYTQQCASANLS